MQDIERVRSLARIAAKMDHSVYVLYERKDGTFVFYRKVLNSMERLLNWCFIRIRSNNHRVKGTVQNFKLWRMN